VDAFLHHEEATLALGDGGDGDLGNEGH
jgi:hypothetical protein